ncbi:hypothetical protein JCM8547_002004 [Rhodosporidiobolus lusitaniae]
MGSGSAILPLDTAPAPKAASTHLDDPNTASSAAGADASAAPREGVEASAGAANEGLVPVQAAEAAPVEVVGEETASKMDSEVGESTLSEMKRDLPGEVKTYEPPATSFSAPVEGGAPASSSPPPANSSPSSEDLARQLSSFSVNPSSPLAPISTTTASTVPKVQDEQEEEWPLKEIFWPPLPPPPALSGTGEVEQGGGTFTVDPRLKVKVICQNRNGPCSLIALCNILVLRNDLTIAPGRESVSYSYLSNLLADYFLRVTSSPSSATAASTSITGEADPEPDLSLEAALSILPKTRYGLDLNPSFSRIDAFSPLSSSSSPLTTSTPQQAPELSLFALARVPLLHGWLSDPSLPEEEAKVLAECGDYDKAVEMVVAGNELAGERGLELREEELGEEELVREVERRSGWSEEEQEVVRRATIVDSFLRSSPTQLTYPGLFALSSTPLLPPSGLAALFRNSHLSVLFRRPSLPSGSSSTAPELFTLVTDASFKDEGEVVWESLGDVDGSASEFWDAGLRRARMRGGDWVGGGGRRRVRDGEGEGRERVEMAEAGGDLALAQQLQAEEDAHERDLVFQRQQEYQRNAQDAADSTLMTPSRGRQPGPPPAPPSTSSAQVQAQALREREKEVKSGRRSSKMLGGKKDKGEKEKCVVS